MGFKVTVAGSTLESADFSVEEAATPLAAGDSSGQVGTFRVVVPVPDAHVPLAIEATQPGYGEGPYGFGPYGGTGGSSNSPWKIMRVIGPQILIGHGVRIEDPRKGFTLGTISQADLSRDGARITLQGSTRLGSLNVFGIQAQPFVGTLRDAFTYYLSLAGETTDVFVDDEIASRPVTFPGWTGELWYYLKLMAAAQDCDISLVSGVILLRAIRKRVASRNREITSGFSAGSNTLAQSVEVYQYNNRAITNELIYPPGGWNADVETLNVNAGETTEYTLELSASVSSIQPPVMQTFVSQGHNSSSVYTIVADDGLPVSPSAWQAYGGSLSVSIDPGTTTLTVSLTGALGLPTSAGALARNFSVALGSDVTGNRYSTLRIVGSGVAFSKTKKRIRTGVPASKTATEVGVTIDNPFISTANDLYRAGTRAARNYTGRALSWTGSVLSVNRRGDSGVATYPSYTQVKAALVEAIGGTPTYAQVKAYYAGLGLQSYRDVRAHWFEVFRDDDVDQVFGNVQGARIFDPASRRWYRIRDASLSPGGINISSADDDLTNGDIQGFYAGMTYGQVKDMLSPLSYRDVNLAGLWRP